MALDRLIDAIAQTGNPTVAGLDPKLDYIPAFLIREAFREHGETLEGAAAAVLAYNRGLIDALCGTVPAIKPQAAYYERLGWPGVRALADTIAYAKSRGMFVITDGKRNDIGATMEAYAAAHLGQVAVGSALCEPFGGDALTVNGLSRLRRYPAAAERMPGAGYRHIRPGQDLQPLLRRAAGPPDRRRTGLPPDGRHVRNVGRGAPRRYGYSGVGAVVGATYPAQLAELRQALPRTFFLVPGYGAQGGGAADVAAAFDQDGGGAVINSSRAIMCAWKKEGCPPEEYAGRPCGKPSG